MSHQVTHSAGAWPAIPLAEWKDTYTTLHMWTQIVGKIRLHQGPWINHSWHSTLYVTSRGLTALAMPHRTRTFQIDFDFLDHRLLDQASDGASRSVALAPRSVADFYQEVMGALEDMDLGVHINTMPNEVADPIPFEQDDQHASYDSESVYRFWQALAQSDRVLKQFRSGFIGKCSPVHFFWGSFDLAVTRFSGRPAPVHPGGVPHLPDTVVREAYSQEVSSCGFWPGGGPVPEAVFYAYAYPEPEGFNNAPLRPGQARYNNDLREFVLSYETVRQAGSPDGVLMEFLQSTYEAAANLARWDRGALERGASNH